MRGTSQQTYGEQPDPNVAPRVSTLSSSEDILLFPTSRKWGVLAKSKQELSNQELSREMRARADMILGKLGLVLDTWTKIDSVPELPDLHCNMLEDGSITLEFALPGMRLMFNLEEHEEDCSWCLVTSADKGSIQNIGRLFPVSLTNLFWLLSYIWYNHAFSEHAST